MTASFDDIRAEVLPGEHLIARLPGLVAVIRRTNNTDSVLLAQLLELFRSASEANPEAPGRDLALQLTRWVVGASSVPDFGTVATAGEKLAVFLHGDINFGEVPEPGSDLAEDAIELAGSEAAFTVDRLLNWPGGTFGLSVGPQTPGEGAPTIAGIPGWAGLRSGAVPGAGVVLGPRGSASPMTAGPPVAKAATAKPAAAADLAMTQEHPAPRKAASASNPPAGLPAPATPAPVAPLAPGVGARVRTDAAPPAGAGSGAAPGWTPPPAAPEPPRVVAEEQIPQPNWPPPPEIAQEPLPAPKFSELIHGTKVHEIPRAPLPVAAPPPPPGTRDKPQPVDPAKPPGVIVKGFRCSRGHLNDPRVSFCSVCGIRMDQLTGILVNERRPPLGLLVLDIGSTFVLDDNYLLGRNPEIDEAVIAGRVRPIRVDDDSGNLSRVHAEIRLEGWDVVLIDRGSANGTYVAGPGQQGWSRLAPLQPFVLAPGTQVRTGRRMFTFESSQARL